MAILLEQVAGQVQTSSATWTTVTTYPVPEGSVGFIEAVYIMKSGSAPDIGFANNQGTVKRPAAGSAALGTHGGGASGVDAPLAGVDTRFQISGNDLQIQALGLAGVTIDWVVRASITLVTDS